MFLNTRKKKIARARNFQTCWNKFKTNFFLTATENFHNQAARSQVFIFQCKSEAISVNLNGKCSKSKPTEPAFTHDKENHYINSHFNFGKEAQFLLQRQCPWRESPLPPCEAGSQVETFTPIFTGVVGA